jgi:metal-responsive CopG/Arc/MetJ family transcriptional regulator
MKTAISVPDATFERVTRRASELGMSRSKLFSRAADDYLDRLTTPRSPNRSTTP